MPVDMREDEQTRPYEHYEPYGGKDALRHQIARTRADLGETIEELASRTDVKARAKEMVSDARERAKDVVRQQARRATRRARESARSGASSLRTRLGGVSRSPVSVAAGAGVGALAGWGIYELLRRRRSR
jgi:hypothetical protein